MNILTIDTATSIEIIAVMKGDEICDRTSSSGVSHSITLFENIDRALKELGLGIKDIELIGVGIGPGSFTGIRIAVTTARMLAQILRVPIAGIKSPLIYASSVTETASSNILVAFDAKKGRVFGSVYSKNADSPFPLEVIPPGDYPIEYLTGHVDMTKKTLLCGSGSEKYYDILEKNIPDNNLLRNFVPSGLAACRLAEHIYNESPEKFNDLNKILPFYSRRSDAETAKNSFKNI